MKLGGTNLKSSIEADKGCRRRSQTILMHLIGLSLASLFVYSSSFELGGHRFFTLADDVMISMSYSRTFANTGVWAWFDGQEPVQGFTNLAWACYLSLLHAIGLSGSSAALAVSLASIFVLSGAAAVTSKLAASINLGPAFHSKSTRAFVAGLLVYLSYPLVFWSLRGFEVGLLALLTISVVLVIFSGLDASPKLSRKKLFLLAMLISLGIWTRLDFAVVPLAAILSIIVWRLVLRLPRQVPLIATIAFVTLVSLFTVLLFQYVTWGDALPNTYYLKATGASVDERVIRGLVGSAKLLAPALAVISAAILVSMSHADEKLKALWALAALQIIGALAYSIYVGGDAWEDYLFANRYVSVSLPLFALLVSFTPRVLPSPGRIPFPIRALLILVFGLSGIGLALPVNSEISPVRVLLGFFILSALATVLLRVVFVPGSNEETRTSLGRGFTPISALVAIFLVSLSGPGFGTSILSGGPQAVDSDRDRTLAGLELKEKTIEGASIAFTWAGAAPYYSERDAIDLLGKSDAKIANMNPPVRPEVGWFSKFTPGHNKYDFSWSIETMQPDVVYQFLDFPGERERLRDLGYYRACLSSTGEEVHLRQDSEFVEFELFSSCTD